MKPRPIGFAATALSTCFGLCSLGAQAQTWTLDFGNSPADIPQACATAGGAPKTCSTYASLFGSYGDVAGIVDVTTRAAHGGPLQWFNTGYNDLYGVAFDNLPSRNDPLSIDLVPLNGGTVTLHHFDLGGYYQSQRRNVDLQVFAIGSNTPLYSRFGAIGSSAQGGNPGAHSGFDFDLSSITGLRVQWSDLDNTSNTGIDNIVFSVGAPVPEPASALLLALGLVPLGAFVAPRQARALRA